MTTHLNQQAAMAVFESAEIDAALVWLLSPEQADNDFAASISRYMNKHGGLTYKQWKALVDSAKGKRFKLRRRSYSSNAAASDASADNTPKAFRNIRTKLTPAQRSTARTAIRKADGWNDYAKRMNIDTSALSGDKLFDAADSLGVDVQHALTDAADKSRSAAQDVFDKLAGGDKSAATGRVDWQRIREIAREEIALRLEPVTVDKIVIQKPDGSVKPLDGATHHPEFAKLAQAAVLRDFSGNRLNIMLVGPTGTGKSYACRQLAAALELDFYFQSQADESFALVGYERVNGQQKYTPFVTAFRDGGVCLLDELDRYDTKALTALNAALANGAMTLDSGEVVKRHKDFVCVGAANTFGMGASSDFTAAEKLDLSTISRFSVRLDWYVHEATERAIVEAKADNPNIAQVWLMECHAVREAMTRLDLPYLADQRCVETGANLLAAGMPADDVRKVTYLASLDDDQRTAVLNLCAGKLV